MTVGAPPPSATAEYAPVGPEYELLGPWWTFDAPSVRLPDAHGRYLSIWTAGDAGPGVLLVPSTADDHRVWEPLLPRLTERFVVHALDLRQVADSSADVEGVVTALAAIGAVDSGAVAAAALWEPPAAALEAMTARSASGVVRVVADPGGASYGPPRTEHVDDLAAALLA